MNDPVKIPQRWRGRRWSALAASLRARNPICERCKERLSEEVHHTVPLSMGGSLYDPRNIVALCLECHHDVTFRIRSQIIRHHYFVNNDTPIIKQKNDPHYSSNNATLDGRAPSTNGHRVKGAA